MKKYLVTSALPYINGVKHLGNLIGSMLPADVYARFLRQEGHEVLYICGTDEHGTPAELAAREEGLPIEAYCQKLHELQKRIYAGFHISFDFFGRTSTSSNHALTTEIFKELYRHDFIEQKILKQYYSPEDHRFLPDRYVEGTCPFCGYAKARGDQCDGCGVLLDPEQLVEPYSAISKSRNIVLTETNHFFLNLPKLEPEIRKWVDQQDVWSDVVRGIAKKWIKDGLLARCITRDLKWGIKVPLKWISEQTGTEDTAGDVETARAAFVEHVKAFLKDDSEEAEDSEKVFYVWFDAPNGYISITRDWGLANGQPDAWKEWWLPDDPDDIFYVEFMAKDNVPFHSIFWPAMLMGTRVPFKKVDDIKGFHWLTYDKGKFSTSQKRGVFTDTALELFPADYWRYYLLANCPETADSDFTFEAFAATVNKDLADIFGNFANRTLALLGKYFSQKVPLTLEAPDADLTQRAQALLNELAANLEARRFRAATAALRALWVLGNEYITQQEPWHVLKSDTEKGAIILAHCIHLLRVFAIASFPFIPETAQKVTELLGDDGNQLQKTPIRKAWTLPPFEKGHRLHAAERLFAKIEDATVAELTAQYAGEKSVM